MPEDLNRERTKAVFGKKAAMFQLRNTESPRSGVFQQEDMLTLSQTSSLFDM